MFVLSNLLAPDNTVQTSIQIEPWGWVVIVGILLFLIICAVLLFKYFNPKDEKSIKPMETNIANNSKRYCKFCGKEISNNPTYCQYCKKKQD